MHCSGVVRMVVHNDRDVESLFGAAPFEMLGDLLLSIQQLSYEGGIEVVVESGIFLLVLTYSLRGSKLSSTVAEGESQYIRLNFCP